MNPTLNILGISGSLRAQSRNTGLLRFAKQCLPPTVTLKDLVEKILREQVEPEIVVEEVKA